MMGMSAIQYVSEDWFGREYGKITVPKLSRRLQETEALYLHTPPMEVLYERH
jgi:hypothetical protein